MVFTVENSQRWIVGYSDWASRNSREFWWPTTPIQQCWNTDIITPAAGEKMLVLWPPAADMVRYFRLDRRWSCRRQDCHPKSGAFNAILGWNCHCSSRDGLLDNLYHSIPSYMGSCSGKAIGTPRSIQSQAILPQNGIADTILPNSRHRGLFSQYHGHSSRCDGVFPCPARPGGSAFRGAEITLEITRGQTRAQNANVSRNLALAKWACKANPWVKRTRSPPWTRESRSLTHPTSFPQTHPSMACLGPEGRPTSPPLAR